MDQPLIIVNVNLGPQYGGKLRFNIDTRQDVSAQVLAKLEAKYPQFDEIIKQIIEEEVFSYVKTEQAKSQNIFSLNFDELIKVAPSVRNLEQPFRKKRQRSLLKSLSIDKENRRNQENSTYYDTHITQAGLKLSQNNFDHINNIMQAFNSENDDFEEENASMIVVPVQEKFPSLSTILKQNRIQQSVDRLYGRAKAIKHKQELKRIEASIERDLNISTEMRSKPQINQNSHHLAQRSYSRKYRIAELKHLGTGIQQQSSRGPRMGKIERCIRDVLDPCERLYLQNYAKKEIKDEIQERALREIRANSGTRVMSEESKRLAAGRKRQQQTHYWCSQFTK